MTARHLLPLRSGWRMERYRAVPNGVTTIYQLTHALAARPTREMTLDCRTLWSVRFCAAKGHFCSLLLSNILVTSAFCRLTISPICFHSIFPVFSLLSLYAGCSYRLEFVSIDKPPFRFFWNSEICFSLITLNNSTSYFSFRKNGGRKSFFMKGTFLLWLYIITTFSHFQAAMLYNLSIFHLYKTQISVIITNITVDNSSRLC